MDLRYALRRLLLALIVAATLNALLTGLCCPVVDTSWLHFGHLSIERNGTDFMPLWQAWGQDLSEGWLLIQATVSLLLGFSVWFVYPQYRPPPPRD